MINVSIVIYHTPHNVITRLLDSLNGRGLGKIFVIDHGNDLNVKKVLSDYDKCIYINRPNTGYGGGHNVALKKSIADGAKYHLVVNPDIYWDDSVIDKIRAFMDNNSDCGLVMPKILYPDGKIQCLCKLLPNPANLIFRRVKWLRSLRKIFNGDYELRNFNYDKCAEIPSLSGCFMFLRMDVIKQVGLFDERYFMYAEDLDLCRRIGDISRTIFYPNAIVYHEYAKQSYHDAKMFRYHTVSIVKYFMKWGWLFDRTRRIRNNECLVKLHYYR